MPVSAEGDDVRFQGVDLCCAQRVEGNAVGGGAEADALELFVLLRPHCGDDFSDPAVRNLLLLAQAVEKLASLDAQECLERPGGVVDAGVDDLAVPAGGLLAVFRVLFQEEERGESGGELCGDGESHHSASDHRDGGVSHGRVPPGLSVSRPPPTSRRG
jgi:hypothetical protein